MNDDLPPPGHLDAPPPETWPRYDEREVIAMLGDVLEVRQFRRDPGALVGVPDEPAVEPAPLTSKAAPPMWDPEGLMIAWTRWREYPDDYERAQAGQEFYTADTVVVWRDERVTFDVLGHRCTFTRWPAPWLRVAITAVLDHVGEGTGPT